MRHDEMIAVIQRHKNGGKIEYRLKADVTWKDASTPWWDFDKFEYRAKPLVIYVEFNSNGKPMHTQLDPYVAAFDRAVKKFVEVME
jgi:hypothetical protein